MYDSVAVNSRISCSSHFAVLGGGGSMNMLVGNFNKWASKAEGVAGNVWGHRKC